MPKLINNQTGQVEDLSHDALPVALNSGSHSLIDGSSVNLIDTDGNPVSVASDKAFEAVKQGYQFPTQAHVDSILHDQEMQQKYGEGLGNEVKAGIEGAARGATFGLSDVALPKLGLVDKEALAERKGRNPISAGVGAAVGIGAGLLVGTEEAGLAEEAGGLIAKKFAPTNLVGNLAKSSARIAESPAVRGILGKYGAHALGSAVEGAAFGAGNVVSEAALGDPKQAAEHALSEIGWGALAGGVIGGAFSGAADVLPATFNKAKSFFEAGDNSATRGLSEIAGKVSGKNPETILKSIVNRTDAIAPEEAEVLARDLTGGLKEQANTVNKAVQETFNSVRPQESEALLEGAQLPKIQEAHNTLLGKAQDVIDTVRAEPDLYPQRFARKVELLSEKLKDSAEGTAAELHRSMNAFKQGLDDLLNFGKIIPPELQDSIKLVGGLRAAAKNSLVDETTFGAAAARQSAVNDAFNEFSTARSQLQKDVMLKRVNNAGRVDFVPHERKVLLAFKDPEKMSNLVRYQEASRGLLEEIEKSHDAIGSTSFDKGSVLSVLEKNKTLQDKLAKGADYQKLLKELGGAGSEGGLGGVTKYALATKVFGPAGAGAVGALDVLGKPGLLASRLGSLERIINKASVAVDRGAKAVFEGTSKSAATAFGSKALSNTEYDKKVEQIQKAVQDPEMLISNMEKATRGSMTFAPNTTEAMHQTASTAIQFLSSKIPNNEPAAPLDSAPTVSAAAKAKFQRYLSAVEKPVSVLGHLKDGTLTPEHMEALMTVHPKTYEKMQKEILKGLTDFRVKSPNKALPIALQGSISLFMGHNMSSSLSPASLQKNAMALSPQQPQAPQGAVKPTQGGMKQLDLSNRSISPFNQAVTRTLK